MTVPHRHPSTRRASLGASVAIAAALLFGACTQSQTNQLPGAPDGADQQPPPTAGTPGGAASRARVDSLEAAARALAITTGCSSLEACASAPLGAKACGGPRTYVAYCRATTDSVALFRTLEQLERAEREYNAASGIASDCALVMPPTLVLDGNSCQARGVTPVGRGG